MKKSFELDALIYAEKHGIIDYDLTNSIMTWVEVLPMEGRYKHQLNLLTMNHLSIRTNKERINA